MATTSGTYVTPEEYLERERQAETKSEYYRGEIFAMAGTTVAHARIVSNLVITLGSRLAGGHCEVFSTDLRLLVDPAGLYTYPDVMVICGKPTLKGERADIVTNPTVIMEVLSESTKNYDRGQRFELYRTIASFKEYLTIAQDRMHVEHCVKQADNTWLLKEMDRPDDTVRLASIGAELSLLNIYRNVDLASA